MSTAGSQRSRRDSRSRHRHRDDSYSDASYSDDYSDDSFVSDNVSRTSQARRGKRAGGRTGTKMSNSRPRGRGGGANTRGQPSPRGPPTLDNVTKRMLSARRIKINELHSELDDLRHQFTDLKKENKLLLRQHKISERQLDRYEGQENEMPAVIQRHSEEVRAVREQQKRQKERYQRAVKKLRDKDEELERTRRLLKKMKVLVDDRQLKERDELAQRAAKYEAESDEKGHRVQQLERHTENLTKNHRHELGIERARHKETAQRLEEAQEENRKLQATLREKEKELEINNIYRHRVMRPPHKLNSSLTSVSSSPIPASSGADPQRGRRRKNSVPSTTPRDRARKFEEKRIEEVRRRKEELDEGYTLYERHPAQKDLSPAGDATTGGITTSEKPSPVASHVRGNPQPNTDDVGEGYVPTFSSLRENKTSDQPPKANQARKSVEKVVGNAGFNFRSLDDMDSEIRTAVQSVEPEDSYNPTWDDKAKKRKQNANISGENDPNSKLPFLSNKPKYLGRKANVAHTASDSKVHSDKAENSSSQFTQSPGHQPIFLTNSGSPQPENHTQTVQSSSNHGPSRDQQNFHIDVTQSSSNRSQTFKIEKATSQNITSDEAPSTEQSTNSQRPSDSTPRNLRVKSKQFPWQPGSETKMATSRSVERATVQRERKLEEEFLQKLNADSQPDDGKDQDTADWLSDVERDKRDRAEAERRSREEELRQREAESRARDEREAQRRRAEETLARQQAEEAGRREREERERKEREEKERREREERERKEREERERAEQAELERQRLANDQLEQQRRKQKDLLLARMKAIDDKDPPASPPSGSPKRDYKHTEPIQNMHQGRPAYNVSVPSLEKAKRRGGLLTDSDDEDGGYKPTFTGSGKKTKPKRQNGFFADSPPTTATKPPAGKSALMDDLFGSPTTPQKKAAASTKRETSSTALFGGGSAIIDSEDPPPRSNAHLLPRRTRQPHTTTLAARPTINAVGSFDDDIEEVVL